MQLTRGHRLGDYEILEPIGAGGMGEVYRARDTKLDREVAIKVLPDELAGDEDRLRRFEREAKTLASLNHPNVAGIHGVDQVDETCFLALELVPGEDLAARLSRGALAVDDRVAHQGREVGRIVNAGFSRVRGDWVALALLETAVAYPGLEFARVSSADGDAVLRSVSPPVLDNRSLFVSPQLHSYRTRDEIEAPPLVADLTAAGEEDGEG